MSSFHEQNTLIQILFFLIFFRYLPPPIYSSMAQFLRSFFLCLLPQVRSSSRSVSCERRRNTLNAPSIVELKIKLRPRGVHTMMPARTGPPPLLHGQQMSRPVKFLHRRNFLIFLWENSIFLKEL